MKEIDFQLIKGKADGKTFKFTNADGTIYDMTDSTATCSFYVSETPLELTCTIDVLLGTVSIPFTTLSLANEGLFEYILEEDRSGTIIPLVRGNITVINYTPFSDSIEAYLRSELPANLTLTMDFRNQKIIYWRRMLQSAFEITDEDLNIESSWPPLVNALLAKLVVYDALMLAATGSFIQFMGGSYTDSNTAGGGGAVKSVETGPAKVEYYDAAASAKNAFSSSPGKLSMFETLTQSLCELSRYLGVKIPMCSGSNPVIIPKYYTNPKWSYPTLDDMDDLIERQPSQG